MEYETVIEVDEIVTSTHGAETVVTIQGLHAEVMVDEADNISVFNVFIGNPKNPKHQNALCPKEEKLIWDWCEEFVTAEYYRDKLIEEAGEYFNSPETTYYARNRVAL